MSDVDALIMQNLDSITAEDGSLKPLPEETPTDVDNGAEPAQLRDPYEEPEPDEGEEPEAAGEEGEPVEEPEGEEEPAEATPEAGTEEDPYTLDDFKDDEYVRVKIDGEEQTIKLRDALQNSMRQQTFDRRAHMLKQLTEQTREVAENSQRELQQYQRGVINTLSKPETLMQYMERHFPDVLDDVAMQHYQRLYEATQGDASNLERYRERRKLQREQMTLKQQREAMQRQQQEAQRKQASEQLRSQVMPAVRKAVEAAGFTQLTSEVRSEIGTALDVRARRLGRQLSPEEVTDVATRVLKLFDNPSAEPPSKRRERKPRHRRREPRPVQGERREGAPRRGGKAVPKYDDMGNVSAAWILAQGQG